MADWRAHGGRLTFAAALPLCLGLAILVAAGGVVGVARVLRAQEGPQDEVAWARVAPELARTVHPLLPGHPSQYWLIPESALAPRGIARPASGALERFARGAALAEKGDFAAALPLLTGVEVPAPLSVYADYYRGIALAGLSQLPDAHATLSALRERRPVGFLAEAVPLRLAQVSMAQLDAERAVDLLEDLSGGSMSGPEDVWLQLGLAAEGAGEREQALAAFRRVYYDFPLSGQANQAQEGIARLQTLELVPPDRFQRELKRAEALFSARRWAQARAAFESIARAAQGDDAELIALRIGECDYYLDRHRAARDAMRPYLERASRRAEARFFHLTATRALGDHAAYVTLARQLVEDFPESSWSEETLNNLASHYVIVDDDDEADRVFRELRRRFPRSRHAERAAWKIGWRAYRAGDFHEAAETFEDAAATFRRADYRPSWLYWAGRSREQHGDPLRAQARYQLTVADYQNSYYGRMATSRLRSLGGVPVGEPVLVATTGVVTADPIPTDALVRALVTARLYDAALREVQYAQRVWGDSPQLQATVAWIRHQQGASLKAEERFNALRGAINTMRRAYPQFLAAGGEDLPADVLRIIFPLDYWNLITKYSTQHGLDPYLIAALMAQESTFTAEIRSSANAYGLMQIIPDAGRQYARKLGLGRFSIAMLTQPETNVRMGTQYFKDLMDRFGGAHFALAGYNAGPNRVQAWRAEKPDLPQDEFIDDIPFPETQNYVKRILGTAEDYRRLYGGGLLDPNASLTPTPAASTATTARPAAQPKAPGTSPPPPPTRSRTPRRR